MRTTRSMVLAAAAGVIATTATAQQASPPFTMATYYRCDYVRQERADTIFRQVNGPALDRQVQAGNLTDWGFSSHRIGGAWRRLETMTAPTLAKLIAAQEAYVADLNKNPKAAAEFGAICGSHDDYIWNRVLGSGPTPSAREAAYTYSRYFNCSDEATADMVMGTSFAAIMNKHLSAGHLSSWGWLTHNLGGTIRRVLIWSGPDLMAVLNGEEMVSGEMGAHGMWGAFSQACNTHTDYVWRAEARSAR